MFWDLTWSSSQIPDSPCRIGRGLFISHANVFDSDTLSGHCNFNHRNANDSKHKFNALEQNKKSVALTLQPYHAEMIKSIKQVEKINERSYIDQI